MHLHISLDMHVAETEADWQDDAEKKIASLNQD